MTAAMLVFPCNVCKTSLSADEAQAGQLVRCPTCLSTLTVPTPRPVKTAVGAGAGATRSKGTIAPPFMRGGAALSKTATGRRFGFNCAYCSSTLEANDAQGGQEGQCPTCGNSITIPYLDRYGRKIDPKSGQIIKPDPHPVHAYAAAGERAPTVIRGPDDRQMIRCPRCGAMSPVTANNCKSCGMPFTMEGTTESGAPGNGLCVASLVVGIIGIATCMIGIFSVLAIVLGIIGYNQAHKSGVEGGKGLAVAGIVCGVAGGVLSVIYFTR
jgi:DNA-directed RNA polymerase subunit RPC12/RpoP